MTDSCKKQLEAWVKGVSIHNKERDECCPDFSCCTPETLAPLDERERFFQAAMNDEKDVKMEMLGIFLSRAITNHTNKKVYVTTGNPGGTA